MIWFTRCAAMWPGESFDCHPAVFRVEAVALPLLEVERMIHHRGVDDVPHLQLADLHRLVVMVALAVDDESRTPRRSLILKPNFTVRVTLGLDDNEDENTANASVSSKAQAISCQRPPPEKRARRVAISIYI